MGCGCGGSAKKATVKGSQSTSTSSGTRRKMTLRPNWNGPQPPNRQK